MELPKNFEIHRIFKLSERWEEGGGSEDEREGCEFRVGK